MLFAQPPLHFLAQINVARANYDQDDPRFLGFISRIDAVNALAERAHGFVWRLKSEAGSAMDIRAAEDPRFLVNMSVWQMPKALYHFVWKTVHVKVYNQRKDWFDPLGSAHMAFWWIPRDDIPTLEDGMARLACLDLHGPTEYAFGWDNLPPLSPEEPNGG
ncbi:DUF3291 domain-containing protein [Candidatus Phycosocius spiralis]|uniref:DUF3291 domain-containing protein n=1 Tax=Candidatus Phycosocius spiralis TaxID=2815099 RepID=A0ABQ4PX91_9PROT|nr:DUF3291 domain-containing protein [Candidatus Phycosocius spiralis]GIU67628.1 hypothetical protein PsB1_1782 [Candidatus Phycosocius spiralis]